MPSLFQDNLADNSQAFPSDSETAQRMSATQRLFQRLGVLKAPAGGGALPQVAPGIMDSYGLAKDAFAPSQRGYAQPMQAPPFRMTQFEAPPPLKNEAYEDAVTQTNALQRAAAPSRSSDPRVAEALAKANAVLKSLGKDPFSASVEKAPAGGIYEPNPFKAMNPLEGPDTGAVNPNAGPPTPSAKDFVSKYLPYAKQIEQETGIPAHFLLGHMLAETGGNDVQSAPGNNFGGVHAYPGYGGQTQRVMMSDGTYHTLQKYATPLEGMRAQVGVYGQGNMHGANEPGISDAERARRLDLGGYGGSIGKGYTDLVMDRVRAARKILQELDANG